MLGLEDEKPLSAMHVLNAVIWAALGGTNLCSWSNPRHAANACLNAARSAAESL